MVKIRPARLEDVPGIVRVHRTEYADFAHGGPWVNREMCAVHLNDFLRNGNHALVATLGRKVVGEVEFFISREPEPFGKNCTLNVIVVHGDYRRQGIGAALAREVLERGRAEGCQWAYVRPEEGVEGFYGKLGFGMWERMVTVSIPTEEGEKLNVKELPDLRYKHVEELPIRFGRYACSKHAWELLQDSGAIFGKSWKRMRFELLAGKKGAVVGFRGTQAYAWASRRVRDVTLVRQIITLGSHVGLEQVRLHMSRGLGEKLAKRFGLNVGDEELTMRQRL